MPFTLHVETNGISIVFVFLICRIFVRLQILEDEKQRQKTKSMQMP